MCDCKDCDCNDKAEFCCEDGVPYVMDEQTGNVSCEGVDCSDCCDILCMQIYDESSDTWNYPCGVDNPCLEACGPTCEHPIPQDGTNPVRPSGMPEPNGTYPSGVCPAGPVNMECGEVSKWFYHEFTKVITYKVNMGPGANPWPWAQPNMRTWDAKTRAQMENDWACANLPTEKLKDMAEQAILDAKQKFGNRFKCAACDNGNVCPLVTYATWKPQTDGTCKNGRMWSSGPDSNGDRFINVSVTVTGRFKVCFYCYKARC